MKHLMLFLFIVVSFMLCVYPNKEYKVLISPERERSELNYAQGQRDWIGIYQRKIDEHIKSIKDIDSSSFGVNAQNAIPNFKKRTLIEIKNLQRSIDICQTSLASTATTLRFIDSAPVIYNLYKLAFFLWIIFLFYQFYFNKDFTFIYHRNVITLPIILLGVISPDSWLLSTMFDCSKFGFLPLTEGYVIFSICFILKLVLIGLIFTNNKLRRYRIFVLSIILLWIIPLITNLYFGLSSPSSWSFS